MVSAVGEGAVEVEVELAEVGGHFDDLFADDEALAAAAVGDEGRDAAHAEFVLFGKGGELRQPGHGAVGVHDFADDGGGLEPSHTGEVHAGLGVSGAAEDAALFGPEREHVAGLDEVGGARCRVG